MTEAQDAAALAAAQRMSHREQPLAPVACTPGGSRFQFEAQRRTYAAFDERVRRLTRGLAAPGVGRGDRVAVFMQNSLLKLSLVCVVCQQPSKVPVSCGDTSPVLLDTRQR